jgi:hypothetical protein
MWLLIQTRRVQQKTQNFIVVTENNFLKTITKQMGHPLSPIPNE